jgi:hypothetical protein
MWYSLIKLKADYETHSMDYWNFNNKDLIPKKMYLNKKACVTTLQDNTITGARNYIKSGKVQSDKI